MLLLHRKTALTTALCAAAFSQLGLAQVAPTTILQIDVENQVEYDLDVSDLAQWATNPNVVRSQPPRNFDFAVGAADIVAVNGQPAKGTVAFRAWAMLLSTAPSDGGMIADIRQLRCGMLRSRFCRVTGLRSESLRRSDSAVTM